VQIKLISIKEKNKNLSNWFAVEIAFNSPTRWPTLRKNWFI